MTHVHNFFLLHWAIINVNNLFMEADFNSIFFRSSSFFCQLPFTFTLTSACVGDSFFSAFIHTFLRLKRKCLYSIKSEQKSEQRMKDASGSEQHKTEAIPYDSFDLLHNFFIVEVGKQQVSFVLLPSRLRKTCWFFKHCSEIWFHPLKDCFVHTQFRMSFFRVDNNFPLFRLRKHEKSKSKQCFPIDERSWKEIKLKREEKETDSMRTQLSRNSILCHLMDSLISHF